MKSKANRTYTIHRLEAGDYGDVVRVWEQAGLQITPGGRDSEAAFREQRAAHPTSFLIARHKSSAIGVVLGTHDQRKGWINRLAVIPAWRGYGVASALVRACEAALAAQGIGIITALVEPENAASAAVFGRLGYTDYPIKYFRKVVRPGA